VNKIGVQNIKNIPIIRPASTNNLPIINGISFNFIFAPKKEKGLMLLSPIIA